MASDVNDRIAAEPALLPTKGWGRSLWAGIGKLTLFFLLLGALAIGVDHGISFGLRSVRTGEQGVWNAIVHGNVNADIIVSGSSRAMSHYDIAVIEERLGLPSYNIGLNGSQTDMQVARLKTYLRHNRTPRILIHNLDAYTFQMTHGEVYDPGQYLPLLHEEDLYRALLEINPETWKWRYLPLYGYATQDMRMTWLFTLLGMLFDPEEDTHMRGFWPRFDSWTEDFDRFRSDNPNGFEVAIESRGVDEVEELLKLSAQRGIRVVLAYSPEFVEVQAMTRNRAEIFSKFRDLADRYGALLLDFSDSAISSNQAYFYNSQHLNADGARAFTHELADRLLAAGSFVMDLH